MFKRVAALAVLVSIVGCAAAFPGQAGPLRRAIRRAGRAEKQEQQKQEQQQQGAKEGSADAPASGSSPRSASERAVGSSQAEAPKSNRRGGPLRKLLRGGKAKNESSVGQPAGNGASSSGASGGAEPAN